jgi:hypothetical protein
LYPENLDAAYWFVGREEAGVQDFKQAVVRANIWNTNPFEHNHNVDLIAYGQ